MGYLYIYEIRKHTLTSTHNDNNFKYSVQKAIELMSTFSLSSSPLATTSMMARDCLHIDQMGMMHRIRQHRSSQIFDRYYWKWNKLYSSSSSSSSSSTTELLRELVWRRDRLSNNKNHNEKNLYDNNHKNILEYHYSRSSCMNIPQPRLSSSSTLSLTGESTLDDDGNNNSPILLIIDTEIQFQF